MKKYNCFSLVEILTVIVIASILFAIALPAVSSMIRGNAATQAGRELMGRIKAARAYAVSKQTPVAIVFYRTESNKINYNYACSAYRICRVKYVEPTQENQNFKGWVFQDWVSEWYFLPRGIAVGLPETMTNGNLPGDLEDILPKNDENDNSLIRIVANDNGDSTDGEFFKSSSNIGASPVYFCDLTDIDSSIDPVTFRNAIVFNAAGMMEKPKNLALGDNSSALQPEKAVIIPLRTAVIDGNTVTVEGEPKEYIPVRIDPSGKTYFYDGFVSF